MQKYVIGLVGPIGAGTSSCKGILVEAGFSGFGYGGEVADYVKEGSRGEINRSNLQFWGEGALEAESNLNYWESRIMERGNRALAGDGLGIVLDSLKYPFQIDFWKSFSREHDYCFKLICVNAVDEVRCDRMIKRARPGDVSNPGDFERANLRDLKGYGTEEKGQATEACLALGGFDLVINNDNSPEYLKDKTRELLCSLDR